MKKLTATLMRGFAHVVPFSDVLETMEIETDNGPVLINRSDFDASKHKAVNPDQAPAPIPITSPTGALFDPMTGERLDGSGNPNLNPPNASPPNVPDVPPAPPVTPPPATAATTPPPPPAAPGSEPIERFVTSKGTGKNQKWFVADKTGTSIAGFNADGYATEAEAIAADKAGPTV